MKIELCVASMEGIAQAKFFEVDRIELCQNLEVGGLTPSAGLIQTAIDSGVSIHVLIRTRMGNFVFSEAEITVMEKDIQLCKEMGVDGVVVGALDSDGNIDVNAMTRWVKAAQGLEVTFHRAMDEINAYEKAIDSLVELGVKRILTSGGKPTVSEGIEQLLEMKTYANNRIEIMCGGGVNASNVKELRDKIQPDAIHFSGTVRKKPSEESIFSSELLCVDAQKINGILSILK